MKKKMVIWLLTLTIAVSTVAGCGASNETAPASDTSTAVDYAASETYDDVEYEPAAESPAEAPSTSEQSASKKSGMRNDSTLSFNSAATAESEAWYDNTYDYKGYDIPDASGEDYTVNEENGFFNVMDSPLSTFAADVDTASYSNMRRFVNEGYGLYDFPAGSIRAEELINYFKYDYAAPKNGDRFGVDAQVSDCPWNKNNKLMILGVNTKELKEKNRPDSNIVFLLDVSGSMSSANKLPLLKDAMELLADNLTENDRVSIVTYASGTDVIIDGVSGDQTNKINRAFEKLKAGGSTNGEGGIELAYEIAQENFIKGGNNRVILATDGDFNVGKCKGDDLKELISEKKETGVFLSVLGFGMGNYSDTTAETLADAGNGNYAYIDSIKEAKKVLVDEMSSTLYTVAKDTKLQVEFNPALVKEYRLIGYENRALAAQDFTDDTKDGGELGAGHQVTAVYEIRLADSKDTNSDLKYQDNVISDKGWSKDEWCTLSIAFKDPDKNESQYMEFPIGANNYTSKPSEDFMFATSVAEYAMALTDSEYLVDMTREEAIDQAIKNVKKIDPDDEYKQEFLELMEMVSGTASSGAWYE
ncbi:MAG: VWA domain-containing protein [Lachnospiraceae bacterium]|nr:VWA domain-containing protein [Lachnospiraceae bacterium]